MKGDPEERAAAVGRYIVESGATVWAAAAVFGVSNPRSGRTSTGCAARTPACGPRCRPSCRKTRPSVTCAAARPRGGNICANHLAPRRTAQYNKEKAKRTVYL